VLLLNTGTSIHSDKIIQHDASALVRCRSTSRVRVIVHVRMRVWNDDVSFNYRREVYGYHIER
jgi:hypothetical protein